MKETIKKMARLARLSLPKDELENYTLKVTKVIEYVKQLEELDTKAIEPTSHAVEVTGKLREDVTKEPTLAKEIISNAPEHDGMFYKVPRVVDES